CQWLAKRLRACRLARRIKERPGGRADSHQSKSLMNAGYILGLMSFLFLFFGYLGVPVPFALMAGVLIGASFTAVSHFALIQKKLEGRDAEGVLAIRFFLVVEELMSSANVVVGVVNLSLALVGHIRGGLSQVVTVFSMFFSEMSGSPTADVAVISRALGRPM